MRACDTKLCVFVCVCVCVCVCLCVCVCVLFVLLQIIQFEKNVEQLKKKVSSQSRQQQVWWQSCPFLHNCMTWMAFVGVIFGVHCMVKSHSVLMFTKVYD